MFRKMVRKTTLPNPPTELEQKVCFTKKSAVHTIPNLYGGIFPLISFQKAHYVPSVSQEIIRVVPSTKRIQSNSSLTL
eukprot:gene12330-20478_t